MKEIILDTLIDTVKILPFLLIAFLLIEYVEHKLDKKTQKLISKSDKFGPVIGSVLGLIPQCGFSVMATNLYVTRIVSLGTLIAIYLSTSDEMIPILMSKGASLKTIALILTIKLVVGMISGFVIDFILRKKKSEKINYEICDSEHCHCEKGIFKSALIHTLKILLFIVIFSFVLNVILEYVGNELLTKLFMKNSIFGPLVASLIGLIPNCGSSIIISELYLEGVISFGSAMAGLLTGSGVAILVLFKSNKNLKENMMILALVYGIGAISGILLEILAMIIWKRLWK